MTRGPFPSEGELAKLVAEVCQDLLAILPMYHRLQSMGAQLERGDSVHVSGGGPSDPTLSAVESKLLEHHRDSARYLAKELSLVARKAGRLRDWLEHDIGPGPGFRQPQSIATDAIVSVFDFAQAVEKQRGRLRQGNE